MDLAQPKEALEEAAGFVAAAQFCRAGLLAGVLRRNESRVWSPALTVRGHGRAIAAAVHTWRQSLIRAHIEALVGCPACSHQDCKNKKHKPNSFHASLHLAH